MDRSHQPEIGWPEKEPGAEADRVLLERAGSMAYRQWGGNPAFAIFVGGTRPPHIVVANYAEHETRAAARAWGYRQAVLVLERSGQHVDDPRG